MRNRFIAAVVVASLASWSGSTSLAATLEAWSTPISHAAPHHSCCPDGHKQLVPAIFFAITPATAPCGNQHPCCVKPVPESSPLLPTANRSTPPGSGGASEIMAEQNLSEKKAPVLQPLGRDTYDFYSVRSTVLRI